ncbi:MAG: hypothetical protein IPN15_21545 [Saprospiraceae bacterium]|nr:hypothetical protein [Candidatus Vicinibacter affinis]
MQELEMDYKERLQAVAEVIQGSDELAAYLEEETPELYKALQETYEPFVAEIYQEVAEDHPLQILELEKVLLNPFFEGLFLPRILGYSVLRGEINDEVKYSRPQEHFKEVLVAIANSTNFDVIKQRIGQTVQLGFSLSSDIWIASLLDRIENKKVKAFLQSMKLDRFRDTQERHNFYLRYKKQFAHYNFLTCVFPQSIGELKVEFESLKNFLWSRLTFKSKHENYITEIHELVSKKEFYKESEFLELLAIVANFINLGEKENQYLASAINEVRTVNPQFANQYFNFLKKSYKEGTKFGLKADSKFYELLDKSKNDDLVKFYKLLETIHTKGFVHEDAIDAVNAFYAQYEGMSINNECLRLAILQQFGNVVENLTEPEYLSFFEISKTFATYMNIFDNSAFNQDVEGMSMKYIQKLLAFYQDKRSREYQDVKKFVSTSFTEYEFMTEKEVVDLFKIKRKKKGE